MTARRNDAALKTPTSYKTLNRQLLRVGRRICTCCGTNKELSEFNRNGAFWRSHCKSCHRKQCSRREKERYQNDAAYRQRNADQCRRYRAAHPDYGHQQWLLEKRLGLARVLNGV